MKLLLAYKEGTNHFLKSFLALISWAIFRILSLLFPHAGPSGPAVTFPKEIYPKQCEIKKRHQEIHEGLSSPLGQSLLMFTRACFLESYLSEKYCTGLKQKPCNTAARPQLPLNLTSDLEPFSSWCFKDRDVFPRFSWVSFEARSVAQRYNKQNWLDYLLSRLPLN